MKMSDLKPANSLAQQFGVKVLCYGPPGSGKTPSIQSAPSPICLVVEPGMLSTRGCDYPCWEANTVPKIEEFFKFIFESAEAKNFQTICVDSWSEVADVYLKAALKAKAHGQAAYGEMATNVMKMTEALYFWKEKHVILLAKQSKDGEGDKYKPYFPGKILNSEIPHKFDEVLYCSKQIVPGQGAKPIPTLTCSESYLAAARDRSGKLADLEPLDWTYIFNKILA